MKRETQEFQVIESLRKEGGVTTLRRLNEIVDFSTWQTKTPEASVRRIVQNSKYIFRVQPGLWALEDMREQVLGALEIKAGNKKSEERFTHSYYQGLLIEIGRFKNKMTYIPAQDKNRSFLSKRLCDIADISNIPNFTYDKLLRRAKTIDVIWFNERKMPSAFYEVEHTTDIKNSLSKFYELQDFHANFYIVADETRKKEFEDKLSVSLFDPITSRVTFINYNRVVAVYESLSKVNNNIW